jgi:mannose-6-phosphate isomerase
MKPPSPFWEILPNRVRRNYHGGALLSAFNGEAAAIDGGCPEDWIASTVVARNPGMTPVPDEGLTRVRSPDGKIHLLKSLLEAEPVYCLGGNHWRKKGAGLGFLAKLLDSSMRLHVQAHPTAAFSQKYLNSQYGKFESYIILGFRERVAPCLRLGFQHAPAPETWRHIIETQDIAAMDACFEPIPLAVGDVWIVPGGMPHAIGEGVLMLEVMEPSDWVVRCEFSRNGVVVPPEGRFMGRDLDFCLRIFDYTQYSVDEIRQRCQLQPVLLPGTDYLTREELAGRSHTGSFVIQRYRFNNGGGLPPAPASIRLLLVVSGGGTLVCGGQEARLRRGKRFILPAGGTKASVNVPPGTSLELLVCNP